MQTFSRELLEAKASSLNERFQDASAQAILHACVNEIFSDQICLVSSFGADSAVLIALALQAKPSLPVVFVDTHKHFDETQSYVNKLQSALEIENLTIVRPRSAELSALDPKGDLHRSNPDQCCHIRKTLPMLRALNPFKAWISGRKRFQNSQRSTLELIEIQDRWLKVNPLAFWTAEDIMNFAKELNLPPHPLVAKGFPSIGCEPCTQPVQDPAQDSRSGRWAGTAKTECGIHFENGRVVRTTKNTVET